MNLSDYCGTLSSYNNGCRCEDCREAQTAYRRDQRRFGSPGALLRNQERNARAIRRHVVPRCFVCGGTGIIVGFDGDPLLCPECAGGRGIPASVDDELGVA